MNQRDVNSLLESSRATADAYLDDMGQSGILTAVEFRNSVLEEAARVVEESATATAVAIYGCAEIATLIRALKSSTDRGGK